MKWFITQGASAPQLLNANPKEKCRETVGGRTSIDVHGATVAEALEIVQELIYETPPTKGEDLHTPRHRACSNLFHWQPILCV